jgi:hypothetical protein
LPTGHPSTCESESESCLIMKFCSFLLKPLMLLSLCSQAARTNDGLVDLLPAEAYEGRSPATWTRESKLPWCEASPPNHVDDEADADQ